MITKRDDILSAIKAYMSQISLQLCSISTDSSSRCPSAVAVLFVPFPPSRAGDRGITAEDMEKSQHTDFNEDTTDEGASVACSNIRL